MGDTERFDHLMGASHRAVAQSYAERRWRAALAAAGYRVAPVRIPVHVSDLLNPSGDKRAAEAAYRAFLEAEPCNEMALEGLAFLLQLRGDVDELIAIRRRAFGEEARRMGLGGAVLEATQAFFSACLGDGAPPPTAPTAYLERMFDAWAETYDRQMVDVQGYRGPELVQNMLKVVLDPLPGRVDAFDAGCGTGMIGEALRPMSRVLEGADLSARMLAQAAARSNYDDLVHGDCIGVLEARSDRYDVVVGIEVLSYFGDAGVFCAAAAVGLRPGGVLIVNTEDSEGDERSWRLVGHRRYQHAESHVLAVAASAGFELVAVEEVILRREIGVPVGGRLFAFRLGE